MALKEENWDTKKNLENPINTFSSRPDSSRLVPTKTLQVRANFPNRIGQQLENASKMTSQRQQQRRFARQHFLPTTEGEVCRNGTN